MTTTENTDRRRITDLLGEYALACDQRDRAVLAETFAPAATAVYDDGPVLQGGAAIVDWIITATEPLVWQQHLIQPVRIRIDGQRADVVAQLVSHQVSREEPEVLHRMLSRYHLELIDTDDGWQISDLRLVVGVHQREPAELGSTIDVSATQV